MYAWVFISLCTTWVSGAQRGKKGVWNALELQAVVSDYVETHLNTGPLQEERVLLTAKPSPAPLSFKFITFFPLIMWNANIEIKF